MGKSVQDIELQRGNSVEPLGTPGVGVVIPCLVLFDGDCGFCNRWVQFLGHRDRRGRVYFAPLLGKMAGRVLGARQPKQVGVRGTMILVMEPATARQRELERSDAVLGLLTEIGGIWGGLAVMGRVVPRGLRDGLYTWVAANRHRWFRGAAVCWVPRPEVAARFLE